MTPQSQVSAPQSRLPRDFQSLRMIAAFTLVVALAALVYWPALQSGFLFDDFANLPALGRYGPVKDVSSLLRYATSGIADPTGRPIATLSFLLDARDWPADPYPFKRTNLIIHLLNGALLARVLLELGRRINLGAAHARDAALGGAALWLLHPLWISTVGYVIQRHAMLPVMFMLTGVLLWFRADDAFRAGRTRLGWALALLSVGVCGLFAGLSKANGFLLPVLLLVLETTVNRQPLATSWHAVGWKQQRLACLFMLKVPTILIVTWLAWKGFSQWHEHLGREWTVGQRLLTQPRMLMDYLWRIVRPVVHSRGLFADDAVASTSLLQPLTTLFSLLGLLGLAGGAYRIRRRFPALAASFLFFLAGHLLESTSIPLELYFEHRNYLPALLLGWPVAIALTKPGRHSITRAAALLALCLALATVTHARALTWADPYEQAEKWAAQLPMSARAQAFAATMELGAGQPARAIARLRPRLGANDPQYALNLIDAECAVGALRPETLEAAEEAIRRFGVKNDMVHNWLRDRLESSDASCPLLTAAYPSLLGAARRHQPQDPMEANRLAQLTGLSYLRSGQCGLALDAFEDGLRYVRHAGQAFGQAGLIATRCGPVTARSFIRKYRSSPIRGDTPADPGMPRLHQLTLLRQRYWEREFDRLERLLSVEAAGQGDGPGKK